MSRQKRSTARRFAAIEEQIMYVLKTKFLGKAKSTKVDSIEEASRVYARLRDASGAGSSQSFEGRILDDTGALVAVVSYNARVWSPKLKPGSDWQRDLLLEAQA